MNLDEMQQLWNASGNTPTDEQRNEMIDHFSKTLRRQRRREMAWLIWIFFVLTMLTAGVAWIVFGTNKMNVPTEWGAILLLMIPWGVALLFLRRFLRGSPPVIGGNITLAQSIAARLAANKAQRLKLKTLGVMYLITIPVLAFSIWQLHSVGKVSSRELTSMVSFLGGALALSAGAVLAKYWLSLAPEANKLIGLTRQFEQPER